MPNSRSVTASPPVKPEVVALLFLDLEKPRLMETLIVAHGAKFPTSYF